MGYVLHILFALGTLAVLELDWAATVERPWAVPLLLLVPYAFGWAARRAFLAGRFRLGSALERLLSISPVALQLVALLDLGWAATLERWGIASADMDEWLGFGLLAGLAPFFVYQLAAIDARARCLGFGSQSVRGARAFQQRLFLSALLPFLAYLAGSSLIARSPEWRVCIEEVGLVGGAFSVLFLALFLYLMPFFLRYAWDTGPIERGWARTTLEEVERRAGFRCRELLVWRTGQQMANAAIVGFTERTRFVFFSDLLLSQLGPRELAAVFAHEIGHARRAHAAVFGAFALGFFFLASLILDWSGIESTLSAALFLASIALCWYLAFGYLSRRFELEADLESLRLIGESGALIRALELVTGAHAHRRSSWRHFSTRDRVAFLEAAERDPLIGLRLRMRLARWRKLGFALLAVTALLQLRELARSWDEDWLVAYLRLGRFEQALERSAATGVDRDIAALARRAASVPAGARDAAALTAAGEEAWRRGDPAAAQEWLDLARLRGAGEDELQPLSEALDAASAD